MVKRFKALVRHQFHARRLTAGSLRWPASLRRSWMLYHLADPHFAFMYDPPPEGEWVALDCETTGLDVRRDKIVSIGAVRIVGNRVLTQPAPRTAGAPERALRPQRARAPAARAAMSRKASTRAQAMRQLLDFIGSRPLVGYLPRVRRRDDQPRDLADARRAAAAAEDRGLGDVLRPQEPAAARRPRGGTSTCASRP